MKSAEGKREIIWTVSIRVGVRAKNSSEIPNRRVHMKRLECRYEFSRPYIDTLFYIFWLFTWVVGDGNLLFVSFISRRFRLLNCGIGVNYCYLLCDEQLT